MHAFSLTPDQQALMDHADRFGRERLYPLAAKMDLEEYWPAEIFPEMAALGMLGTTVPAVYGGAGMSLFDTGIMLQAFARWNHALALSWIAHDNLCTHNIARNGSDEVRQRYLPGLCSGELVGCLGLTEPGAGSDALGSMRTRAVADGDDFLITGNKLYITNGPVADLCLLYAKTQPDAGSKGITAFVVETATPGFAVAQKLVKMGFRGSQTAELVLDQVRVPRANIVGELHQGHRVVMSGLDVERALVAPISVGIAERALALCIDYARTRVQFGKPIASFQMVQAHIADMYVWVETMKTFSARVLAEVAEVDETQTGRGAIHALTAAAVMYCANMCNQVLDRAVQVHGGSGYIWEAEINRLFRATKLLEIGAGTTEVRKMIIAGELLGP